MISTKHVAAMSLVVASAISSAAHAQPAQPLAQPAAPLAQPDPKEQAHMERAGWSGKRLAVEILAGTAAGVLTTLALCNGSSCPADGWLAFGADFAVTPLAVYGVGHLMGGEGSLRASYLGAAPALLPMTIGGGANETPAAALSRIQTEATISAVILPVCSALLYEVTSQVTSVRWRTEHRPALTVQPVYGQRGVAGGVGALSVAF